MKRIPAFLLRALCPSTPLLTVLILGCALSLTVLFIRGDTDTPVSYAVYTLSAYTTCCAVRALFLLWRRGRALLHRNTVVHRWLTDPDYKARLSLRLSLFIDLCYSLSMGAAGLGYRSWWFATMAFYYLILCVQRLSLWRHLRRPRSDALRQVRFCGYLLLSLTLAVAGMAVLVIRDGRAIRYPGYLIYAVAAYTFYKLGMSFANLLRYRRLRNPIYSADKTVTFSTALVSLFSLQVAMFTSFGGDFRFQQAMNAAAGLAVFLTVAGISLSMIFRTGQGGIPPGQAGSAE